MGRRVSVDGGRRFTTAILDPHARTCVGGLSGSALRGAARLHAAGALQRRDRLGDGIDQVVHVEGLGDELHRLISRRGPRQRLLNQRLPWLRRYEDDRRRTLIVPVWATG